MQKKPLSILFDWLDRFKIFKPVDVSDKDIEFLRSIYLPEKERLEKLLGRELACWKYGKK